MDTIVDDDLRMRCQALREFAEGHPWPHMDRAWNPGTHPGHQLDTRFGYHLVFSITLVRGFPPFRHFSVSLLGEQSKSGELPNYKLVCQLAHLFGFMGHESNWSISIDPMADCITINQPMLEMLAQASMPS